MKKNIKAGEAAIKRISRIEGQLQGIRRMLEGEKACMDVMVQIFAIREAVSALGVEILKDDLICNKKSIQKLDEKYLKTLFKIN
ncbi:hypothetical protein C0584_02000 [Candidatus Parcubacteria bacterium]|nr:MAG: hypothetical protein C0584_02000 [Candidatus Parcubacteria bacterium]